MTDRFKKCHDEITMAMAKDTVTPKKIKRDIITINTLFKNVFVINEALTLAQEAEQLRKERDELDNEVLSVINQALCFPSVKEGTNCITLDAYYALEKLRDKIKDKKVSEQNGNA